MTFPRVVVLYIFSQPPFFLSLVEINVSVLESLAVVLFFGGGGVCNEFRIAQIVCSDFMRLEFAPSSDSAVHPKNKTTDSGEMDRYSVTDASPLRWD